MLLMVEMMLFLVNLTRRLYAAVAIDNGAKPGVVLLVNVQFRAGHAKNVGHC